MTFKRGQQIRYVPNHASGLEDDACEDGFVTRDLGKCGVMCRYWSKTFIGQLRTKANGELTSRRNLILHESTTAGRVRHALEKYCKETAS